eukprot:COSAG05_NODE_1045_length_6054_cov_5.306969_5_plen_417_part_00
MPSLRLLPLLLAHPCRAAAAAATAAAAGQLVVPAWDAKMEFKERCIEVASDAMSTPGQPRNFTNNSRWSFWSMPEGQAPPGGWPVLIQLAIIPYPAANATAPHCGMDGYNPPDSSGPWLAEQQRTGQNANERRSQERRRAKAYELALAAARRRVAEQEHMRPHQPLLPPELRELGWGDPALPPQCEPSTRWANGLTLTGTVLSNTTAPHNLTKRLFPAPQEWCCEQSVQAAGGSSQPVAAWTYESRTHTCVVYGTVSGTSKNHPGYISGAASAPPPPPTPSYWGCSGAMARACGDYSYERKSGTSREPDPGCLTCADDANTKAYLVSQGCTDEFIAKACTPPDGCSAAVRRRRAPISVRLVPSLARILTSTAAATGGADLGRQVWRGGRGVPPVHEQHLRRVQAVRRLRVRRQRYG